MKKYKPLPIGIDNFEEIIQKGCYYVDKTLLIKNILDGASKVTLFTRPRRFGKSLNLSMLKYFLERSEHVPVSGVEESVASHNRDLFQGLKIMSAGEKYQTHMGKYPVIMLNFKEGKQGTFQECYELLVENIAREFARHEEAVQSAKLNEKELERYQQLRNQVASKSVYIASIRFLCQCLEKAYGEKVVILLDEYDVPLENAHFRGFYEEMIDFIRGLLGGALKTNDSLAFAVITGCLRISKESIFTGLNNLEVVSIENKKYGEYFGFTEEEVEEMLVYYDRTSRRDTVREWYNGYVFGVDRVYNPWSLVNYMNTLYVDVQANPVPYWSHSSGNSIVKDLVNQADLMVKN
ncbi:MAG: AAA family ATPase, partial [Eubacteriales bacterium]